MQDIKEIYNKIGSTLKDTRLYHNLTNKDMEAMHNIPASSLFDIENAKHGYSLGRIIKYANALGYKFSIKLEKIANNKVIDITE